MMQQPSTQQGAARRAFTVVEILIVVALVLVLLSIVVVAVNAATRSAQRSNTTALMNSIKQALVAFESDVGYLPPVLRPNRDLVWPDIGPGGDNSMNGPDPSNESQFRVNVQEWYSITTLPDYLIGYGPAEEDGHDGPGIRNPGPDGYWGASQTNPAVGGTAGTFVYRTAILSNPISESYRQGRVLGPYLQLRDDRLLGAINPDEGPDDQGRWNVRYPGDAGYNPEHPRVIVDYWGEPIRFYRRPYPMGGINRGYRQVRGQDFQPPTLSDVFLLRPYRTHGRTEIETRFEDNAVEPTRASTYELNTAAFALFSSGPNRQLDAQAMIDEEELNEDNIVVLGP